MFFFLGKNPTPRQLAHINASVISITYIIIYVINCLYNQSDIRLIFLAVTSTLLYLTSYFVLLSTLNRFIYRKIKLIYKTIHSLKASKIDESNLTIDDHMIDEVEKEVTDWATNWKKEMTDLKSMEEYRRQFIGNVSHELKTPIFNIQGYLHTLLDGGVEDDSIKMKYLSRAADNAERMAGIVSDLGYISKFESGKLKLNKIEFNVCDLAVEVIEDLEMNAAKKGIQLMLKNVPKSYIVIADVESIRRVLINLITNSIKYGVEKGITTIGFYDMADNILIEVTDNGRGIDQEHLPHLFDRFYRVDKGRSREEGGSGLGLSIVKHIIEAHQQNIHVRSKENVGSTFSFTLEKAT